MKQTRFVPIDSCEIKVREVENDGQKDVIVDGVPILFGVRSVDLTPLNEERAVYEIMEPGCISQELIDRSDVVLNINHSMMVTDVLGRHRNSERDTLKLTLHPMSVSSSCVMPHTNNAHDTTELLKRGDITGMSFAFLDDYSDSENGVSYERTDERTADGREVWLRHVKRVTGLYDVSIVTHPAYEQTSVGVREQSDAINRAIEEQMRKQREVDEEKTKEDEERADEPETNSAEATEPETDKAEATDGPAENREEPFTTEPADEPVAESVPGGEPRHDRGCTAPVETPDSNSDDNQEPEGDDDEEEQRERECRAMILRSKARIINDDILESLIF